ncbi:MAG: branched-chain amino acid ABC transporter permease [Candidatus Promineifilaceae bacterium]|jgi:branched-chain amino acid transport system permease protein
MSEAPLSTSAGETTQGFSVFARRYVGLVLPLLIVLGMIAWPMITGKDITRETMFTVLLSVALASSLNILLGYTGYVSFGQVVFFGLGGYVGIYLMSAQGWSLWGALAAGGLAAGLLAFLLGKAILRLRGGYFALATIGINEAMRATINNMRIFGGPVGMTLNFQVYKDYGGAAQALWLSFYILSAVTLVVVIVSYFIRTSKFGLGLLAIREDEDAAEIMGVVAPNAKTWAYVISAIAPGILGVLFFFKNGSIEPAPAFRLHFSIEMIVMVMLGGQGTVLGPIVGAMGYQGLRGFLLTNSIFKNIQLAVAGGLLLLIVLFVPRGIVGWLRTRFPKLRKVLI